MFCVCGRKLPSTSATPWIHHTVDSKGKVTSGMCQHGIIFPTTKIEIYRKKGVKQNESKPN